MLARGIKNAEAKAFAAFRLYSLRRSVLVENQVAQFVGGIKSAVLRRLMVFRNTNGVCPFHMENASTSLASTARENTRTPFASGDESCS